MKLLRIILFIKTGWKNSYIKFFMLLTIVSYISFVKVVFSKIFLFSLDKMDSKLLNELLIFKLFLSIYPQLVQKELSTLFSFPQSEQNVLFSIL